MQGEFGTGVAAAVFADQMGADQALQRLRLSGFPDSRIRYYSRTTDGGSEDQLARGYRLVGAALGIAAGLALGGLVGWGLSNWAYPPPDSPDPRGLATVCALVGGGFLGLLGGTIGWGLSRRRTPGPADLPGPFVIAVDAGPDADRARAVLADAGGHQPHAAGTAAHH